MARSRIALGKAEREPVSNAGVRPYAQTMGFDAMPCHPDRDREETYPWMGLLAIVAIVVGLLLIVRLGFWDLRR